MLDSAVQNGWSYSLVLHLLTWTSFFFQWPIDWSWLLNEGKLATKSPCFEHLSTRPFLIGMTHTGGILLKTYSIPRHRFRHSLTAGHAVLSQQQMVAYTVGTANRWDPKDPKKAVWFLESWSKVHLVVFLLFSVHVCVTPRSMRQVSGHSRARCARLRTAQLL